VVVNIDASESIHAGGLYQKRTGTVWHFPGQFQYIVFQKWIYACIRVFMVCSVEVATYKRKDQISLLRPLSFHFFWYSSTSWAVLLMN